MAKSNNRLFGGAGIIVRKPGEGSDEGPITVVETENAPQVSALIYALKDVFAGSLDYLSKYEFYGRLADAANAQLAHGDDRDAIRAAIIGEACAMVAEMGSHLYFAYGSNMDAGQMSYRCPDAIFAGTASLPGYAFELDSAGVATVVERDDSVVLGALWLVSEADKQSLDRYEGVASGCYRKDTLTVIDGAGRELTALMYVSNRDVHDGVTYRTGYMANIIENARRLGFDEGYVELLEAK